MLLPSLILVLSRASLNSERNKWLAIVALVMALLGDLASSWFCSARDRAARMSMVGVGTLAFIAAVALVRAARESLKGPR